MEITATELKQNLGHYLDTSRQEDVYITRNGKVVSKLTSPYRGKRDIVESLVGILPADYDAEAALGTRRAAV